jgi:carboxymethylenebutenolidase
MRLHSFAILALLAATVVSVGLTACGNPEMSDDEYADRMGKEHKEDSPVPGAASLEGAPAIDIESETVTYATVEGAEIRGHLARPKGSQGSLPGIIVIQEWWGLNDNIRTMADKLAGEGYTALAVDLYDGQVAEDSEKAQELMRAAMGNVAAAQDNLKQAYTFLEDKHNAPKIGTIGWCFGGGWSLNTALMLPDQVDATAIYYGRLETDPEKLKALQMPILGIFGAEDQGIPLDMVKAFESALDSTGKDASIHIYEGADHAFANPSGTHYEPDAAQDAWQKTLDFFAKHLK